MKKNFTWRSTIMMLTSLLFLLSCVKERYRTDRNNQLSAHAEKSDNYLQNQATEITQSNNKKREANEKKTMKRNAKEQERLNELNSRSSKVKKPGRKTGTFNIY